MGGVRIEYREFYDVPRAFLVRYKQRLLFFESLFSEYLDDYSQTYDVYLMPELATEETRGSWEELSRKAIRKICEVAVSKVKFDSTRRKEIDTELLEELLLKVNSEQS